MLHNHQACCYISTIMAGKKTCSCFVILENVLFCSRIHSFCSPDVMTISNHEFDYFFPSKHYSVRDITPNLYLFKSNPYLAEVEKWDKVKWKVQILKPIWQDFSVFLTWLSSFKPFFNMYLCNVISMIICMMYILEILQLWMAQQACIYYEAPESLVI